MIVVKVGGSLFDLPDFDRRITGFLSTIDDDVILVPGGGVDVDALRQSGGDEESCHWRAIEIMSKNGARLSSLRTERVAILDATSFVRKDEDRLEKLPHSWDVTSDSIAARVAEVHQAKELLLLKSTSFAGDWHEAANAGYVDRYFPTIASRASFRICCVDLRGHHLETDVDS